MSLTDNHLLQDKHLKKYLLALIILALLLGIWVVPVEYGYQINTIGDGLWWAIGTATGVGSVLSPQTNLGRLIGVILMTVGLMLFSSVIALVSGSLMDSKDRYHRMRQQKILDSLNNKLYRLEHKVDYLIKEKKSL
jgi:hypothetical protein